MSVNVVVWKWAPAYDSAAKRRQLGIAFGDVLAGFAEHGTHAGMARASFRAFEKAVAAKLGPAGVDGDYLVETYPRARVFSLRARAVPALVIAIGTLARAHGLTAAEL